MADLISRNRIENVKELCIRRNSSISVKQNPKSLKFFFTCGHDAEGKTLTGYCSDKAAARWAEEDSSLEEFQYAECKVSDKPDTYVDESGKVQSNWIPCLMLRGTGGAKEVGTKGMEFVRAE